ncbi:hypothetical protein LNTAR_01982 [Lentisphaera araneosa HTCC2155]|uniref:Protein SirB1 N-terminal domain-containing protein n=1 Tax=Lentisphaera araneosa HTCC2155 TaxID=313628 RepID=A6DP06_9BACT|nr:hypothetical protein [Lentisphaera araneosa]EDM26538.1 hypothetical protein LNTAR_01982 [Lentisphaera araneosa HTCC2155]
MSEKEALLKLLEDEDPKIATIAIGKLLQYGPDIFPALRGLQESANPLLRKRVHQIEAILEKKINFSHFIERIEKDEILIWEDLIYLNSIYYPDLKPSELQSSMEEAYKNLSAAEFNTKALCNYMKDKNYYVPKNDILDSGINLISSVLINGEGSPLMLCIISQLWGTRFSWPFQIVLHKGHHCLIDKNKMLIEPANNWKCSLIDEKIKAHPCTEKGLILTVIANLYLSALVEGQLKILHTLSTLMSKISKTELADFPFPIGKENENTLSTNQNESC